MKRLLWFITTALLLPAAAHAQPADPTPMSFPVDAGEHVIVTRIGAPGTIRGRVVLVKDEGLVLDAGATRVVVPLADVQRVERRKDRFWNGALIGYGVGFAAGAAMVLADPCGDEFLCFDGPQFAAAVGAVVTGPMGFAVGGITDAIRRKPRVVFDRGGRSHVAMAVAPALTRRGAGLRVAVAF